MDVTNSWFSYYRKTGAYISNIANTIYTQILNGGINFRGSAVSTGYINSGAVSLTDTSAGTAQSSLVPTKLSILSPLAGYSAQTQIELQNGNATAGNTTGVPSMDFYKFGRNVVQNDVISSLFFYAKNYLGTKTLFSKIETVVTNSSLGGGDDGALDFYTCVNGTSALVMRLNGADNENNSFRPLDMNGNNIRTASGNMTIDTSGSSGTGTLTLATKDGTAGSGAGLLLTGNTLLSGSAGPHGGQHLCLTIGGTVFKIALLAP
jgi:hypothetical protein